MRQWEQQGVQSGIVLDSNGRVKSRRVGNKWRKDMTSIDDINLKKVRTIIEGLVWRK